MDNICWIPPFMEAQPNDWWWDKYSIALEKLQQANELRKMIKQNKELDKDSAENKEMEACLHDARKRMQLFWRLHTKKKKFEDDDFKDIALNLIHPKPESRMDITQIIKHKWFTKGPFYNKDELKLYLTKRVKIVLQGRARKIRKLMQQQNNVNTVKKDNIVRDVLDPTSKIEFHRPIDAEEEAIWRKLKDEIDEDYDYDHSLVTVKDELLPGSTWQIMTKYSPGEVAIRIQNAAVKHAANCTIKPKDNIVCSYNI